mgnify:CR=1 FL=1
MSTNDLGPLVDELHEEFKDDVDYRAECLYNDITAQILDCMRERHITRAELAKRMDVSEARVSRMFSETQNFTLATVAKLALALGVEIEVTVKSDAPPREGRGAGYRQTPWNSAPTCAEAEPPEED